MTKDKALTMALDFIERVNKDGWLLADFEPEMYAAITAIKESLKQSEQEPVGKFAKFTDGIWREVTDGSPGIFLYTAPPQREWVGLTYEEATNLWESINDRDSWELLKQVEKTLREKNT